MTCWRPEHQMYYLSFCLGKWMCAPDCMPIHLVDVEVLHWISVNLDLLIEKWMESVESVGFDQIWRQSIWYVLRYFSLNQTGGPVRQTRLKIANLHWFELYEYGDFLLCFDIIVRPTLNLTNTADPELTLSTGPDKGAHISHPVLPFVRSFWGFLGEKRQIILRLLDNSWFNN